MPEFFTHGLHQGHTTETSIKLWGRCISSQFLVFRLLENNTPVDFREVTISAGDDYTFTVEFEGLSAGKGYQVLASDGALESEPYTFYTSEAEGDLHFVFGSCRYNHWDNIFQKDGAEGDETYEQILKLHNRESLDALFLLGDQIYADPTLMVGVSQSFKDYTSTYQESFQYDNFQRVLHKVPTYMLLDDHEIRNNWSQDLLLENSLLEDREEMFKNGCLAYECWQHSRNPRTAKGEYWYSFEKKGFPFFFMDIRTRRWHQPDEGLRRTTLGDAQLNDLFAWLLETKEKPVRFIASGIPFCPDTIEGEDKWDAFDEERSLLLEFIRLENIGKTVFLSGDVHVGAFAKMECLEADHLNIVNLVSSPLYWPYPGMKRSDFYEEKVLKYNQWQTKRRCQLGEFNYPYKSQNWLRENQFCEVKMKPDGEGVACHFNMKKLGFEEPWYF